MAEIVIVEGRREVWTVIDLVGGYVCAEPVPGNLGDICGMPVESEPCSLQHTPQEVTQNA